MSGANNFPRLSSEQPHRSPGHGGNRTRSEWKRLLNDEGETGRLVTFCDGVFAVAITVLVFNLQLPPQTARETLLEALLHLGPIYVSYVSSFLLIGIFWINHHRVCRHIKRADRLLLAINLLFLMCIAIIPFPTAILGKFVLSSESKTAALIYGGSVFVTMIMFNFMWWYAQHNDLVDESLDLQLCQGMARSYLLGTLVYLFAVVLSLVYIVPALVLYIFIPSLYILTPPFEHLLASKPRHHAEDAPDEAS